MTHSTTDQERPSAGLFAAPGPAPVTPPATARPVPRLAIVVTLALVVILGPFLVFGSRFENWTRNLFESGGATSLAAQAACVLLLASDVVLPVPSSLVSTAGGALWGGWVGALLSTLGMTLGSCLGYGLGRWARAGVRRWLSVDEERRLRRLYTRHGDWMVVVSRPVPVLAEASAVFAGMSRMSAGRFVALSAAANSVVSVFYAALGTLIARHSEAVTLPLLVAALAAIALALAKFAPRGAPVLGGRSSPPE